MVLNYVTNLPGRSQTHTGTQVRIAAQGPQAANVVGVTDQTDLFHTVRRALGLPEARRGAAHRGTGPLGRSVPRVAPIPRFAPAGARS